MLDVGAARPLYQSGASMRMLKPTNLTMAEVFGVSTVFFRSSVHPCPYSRKIRSLNKESVCIQASFCFKLIKKLVI